MPARPRSNGSDGIPDRIFFRDIRSATHPPLRPGPDHAGRPAASVARRAARGIASNGAPGNRRHAFQLHLSSSTPTGNLSRRPAPASAPAIIGGIIGGNGQTGREGEILSVLPDMERYNFNLLAHYDFSDAFEPFFEAKWNRVNALGNNAGPSFIQGTQAQFDFRERVRLDNPFLDAGDGRRSPTRSWHRAATPA